MATTTGTRKRNKKSETPAENAAPDMSGEATKAAEPEPSLADEILDAIKEESVRIMEDGSQVKDPVSFLTSLTDEGVKLAKTARSTYIKFSQATGAVADVLVNMRKSIILPSGLPDWAGASAAYKKAAGPVIDAAQGPDESRATVANRIQRRITRKLGEAIALQVNHAEKLNLDEEEVRRIVQLGPKALTSDELKDNAAVKSLVDEVNSQFRVGEHARNEPTSPFESPDSRTRTTPNEEEGKGAEALRSLPQFRANMNRVTLDLLALEVLRIIQEFDKIVSGKNPAFGKGRAVVAETMGHVAVLSHAVAKKVAQNELTKNERESMEKALAVAK